MASFGLNCLHSSRAPNMQKRRHLFMFGDSRNLQKRAVTSGGGATMSLVVYRGIRVPVLFQLQVAQASRCCSTSVWTLNSATRLYVPGLIFSKSSSNAQRFSNRLLIGHHKGFSEYPFHFNCTTYPCVLCFLMANTFSTANNCSLDVSLIFVYLSGDFVLVWNGMLSNFEERLQISGRNTGRVDLTFLSPNGIDTRDENNTGGLSTEQH